MKGKYFAAILLISALFFLATPSLARTNVTDWYIKDFESQILVEKNSSLLLTEKITADCGNAPGKHGIFRIVPTRTNLEDGTKIETPVELLSITDFENRSQPYAETLDEKSGTVIWKIGDPAKTVSGENHYLIKYRVYNAIRFTNPNFDEFYWNLNGNFWDLETDNFRAEIKFPSDVNQDNAEISYYTGPLGSKSTKLATYQWTDPNTLQFQSTGTLPARNGITVSVTFPKGIFTAYLPENLPKKSASSENLVAVDPFDFLFGSLIPISFFIFLYTFWRRFGKDPNEPETVIPEYEPPAGLSPSEMGVLMGNGQLKKQFLTAEIINLAVKGTLKIEEIKSGFWIFKAKDFELTRLGNESAENILSELQKKLLDLLFQFGTGNKVKLTDLRNKFAPHLKEIEKKTQEALEKKSLVLEYSYKNRNILTVAGFVLLAASFFFFKLNIAVGIYIVLSSVMTLIFAPLMTKKTLRGAEIDWKIKGFKLFMQTVDKHRAEFYEKENIFEKFLPYAIAFGITKIWIEKMKEIYGEDFYAHYAPAWYAGNLAGASFDANALASSISSLSSAIGSNVSSTSGSGGAGGSGGGGGGGGGGGW